MSHMNFMSRITRDFVEFMERKPAPWMGLAPLALMLPALVFLGADYPRWVLMWMLALTFGITCKWLTWWGDGRWLGATPQRTWAYCWHGRG